MNYEDPEFDLGKEPQPFPPIEENHYNNRKRYIIILAVIIGVLLFGGILWQTYMFGKISGSEEAVPLIKADTSASRVRPEEPGGLEIPDQDRQVFNMLEDGKKQERVESLLQSYEEPLPRPAATDTTGTEIISQQATVTTSSQSPPAQQESLPTLPPKEVPSVNNHQVPEQQEAAKATAQPTPAPQPVKTAAVTKPTTKTTAAKTAKPTTKVASSTPAKTTAVAVRPAGKINRIQIMALSSEDAARTEVSRLQKRFPEKLGSLTFWISKVTLEGRGTFYRVQAGPVTGTQAQELCKLLKSNNLGCIVVRQ